MKSFPFLLAGVTFLAACQDPSTTAPRAVAAPVADRGQGADVQKDLATLRRVTAKYHRFEAGKGAGWNAQITTCMVSKDGLGAMGYHYGNPGFINDGKAQVDEPELLIYEPEANGRMRLVGIEYIVPLDAWHSPNPPRLFGRDFKVNDAFRVWALHAWVWKENPSGIFADWNPKASCDAAPPGDIMRM